MKQLKCPKDLEMRELVKTSLQIAGAFVGLIVGGGFASGQEIMQFFTSFGWYGILGGVVAAIGFTFLGMNILQLGSELQTSSHKEAVYHIAGRRLGFMMDMFITFFLFGVTVAMFAGAGSALYQMFGIPIIIGSLFMVTATVLTLMLNMKSIISIIGVATPYLLAIIIIVTAYAISTVDISLAEQHALAKQQPSAAPNWLIGSLLYVSYNTAAGLAMLTVIGSTVRNKRSAAMGGVLGGVLLGILIILMNVAMFSKMDVVDGTDMPILEIAKDVHPIVGILMGFALIGMIYSTAVGMLYSFVVRFVPPKSKAYKPILIIFGFIGLSASLVGFTTLVGKVYSAMGYLGSVVMLAIFISWYRRRRG